MIAALQLLVISIMHKNELAAINTFMQGKAVLPNYIY